MDITEMIAQAEADFERAEADLLAAQDQTRVAKEREEHARMRAREMQAVRDWLRTQQAVDEQATKATGSPTQLNGSATPMRFGRPVPEVPQTDLCLRVLRNFRRPASTKEVRDRLALEGHEVEVDKVRSSLRYLSTKKPPLVATNTGTGVWWVLDADHSISAPKPH